MTKPIEQHQLRRQVSLDADTVRILRAIGNGNLSRGIREAAMRLAPIAGLDRAKPR